MVCRVKRIWGEIKIDMDVSNAEEKASPPHHALPLINHAATEDSVVNNSGTEAAPVGRYGEEEEILWCIALELTLNKFILSVLHLQLHDSHPPFNSQTS